MNLEIIGWILGIGIISTLLIYLLTMKTVSRYEYLEALSFMEWKPGRQVVKELEKMKNASISYGTFYIGMRRLCEEGYAECREVQGEGRLVREFRKVQDYTKRRKRKRKFFKLKSIQLPWSPQPQT